MFNEYASILQLNIVNYYTIYIINMNKLYNAYFYCYIYALINSIIMKLRVKEICKEKGIMLKDVAKKLSITEVGLSKSLNGNPPINRLEEIANALDVSITELFETKNENEFYCPNCGTRLEVKEK